MRQKARHAVLMLLALLAALALAACAADDGGDTTDDTDDGSTETSDLPDPSDVQAVLDALADMPEAERQETMVEQAAAGDPVIIYSTDHAELQEAWQQAITEAYPEVDIEFVRMNSSAALERFVAESEAGQPVASLVHMGGSETALFSQEGMLADYSSPEAEDFDELHYDPDGQWTATSFSLMVAGYNTDLASEDEVPTTLEGMTDPSLKGRTARTSIGARWVAGVIEAKGEEEGMEIVEGYAANEPRLFDSNSGLADALGAGQVPIIFDTQIYQVENLKNDGAPVEYVLQDTMFAQSQYLAVPNDAPNPYGAALVYDWVLSRDGGQAHYEPLLITGPRNDMEYPFSDDVEQIDEIIAYSPTLLDDVTRYEEIFVDLFQR